MLLPSFTLQLQPTTQPQKTASTMVKRASNMESEREPKRRALVTSRTGFQDGASVRQSAERYKLATAKMPLDSLSCTWQKGKNRGLQAQQVSRLCEDFRELGLAREAEENYILVQCEAGAVERMLEKRRSEGSRGSAEVVSFEDWAEVNDGAKVEVLAGQHRIAALRKYVERTKSGAEQLWWTCHIYDKGEIAEVPGASVGADRRRGR